MKSKILLILLSIVLVSSCKDYDSQFDQINQDLNELAAANAALESQIASMSALNATVSAQTTAKLLEFQTAVTDIISALQSLGGASAATIAQINAIIQAISDLSQQIASNATCASDLRAAMLDLQNKLDIINGNLFDLDHYSGGGQIGHYSGGTHTPFTTPSTDNGDNALNLIVAVPCGTTTLRLSGPWWGWDPNGGPVGIDNGDGTFTFTFDPAPTENMEYLYTVDGVSYENLVDNAQNAECSGRIDNGRFNTDYANYANRIWIVGSGDQAETYDSCSIDTID